jgi:DNA repair exonuclease SbcCD ATPase subunit
VRIIRFQAENIKKLHTVQIDPQGNLVKLSGANGSGKTSILDAIEYALRGTANVPSKVITTGKKSGTVQIDLGEVVVTRKFSESGRTTLQIMSKENRSIYPSPQSLLDNLTGKISFDPLEFIRMDPHKQFLELRRLTNLDLTEIDEAIEKDYTTRREVKKEYQAIEARRDVIHVVPDLPLERRDEEALTREIAEVANFNEEITRQQLNREKIERSKQQIADQIAQRARKIEALRLEIEEMEQETERDRESIENIVREMDTWKPLPEPKNASDLADELSRARIVNAAIGRREQRDALQKEIDALQSRHEALGTSLENNRATRIRMIEEAHFPIEGLSFGEDEVLWQGLPFNQVSNADQIRASVAIGMASNPRLRVMRVKDGSLLDSHSMKIVAEMAKDEDFQIWIEMVDESGKVGIYLEDGEVKAVNGDEEIAAPERDMRIALPMPDAKPIKKVRTRKAKA